MRYKFNDEYNIIVIESEQPNNFNYYLEKTGSPDLAFFLMIEFFVNPLQLIKEHSDKILKSIKYLKNKCFWED